MKRKFTPHLTKRDTSHDPLGLGSARPLRRLRFTLRRWNPRFDPSKYLTLTLSAISQELAHSLLLASDVLSPSWDSVFTGAVCVCRT
jgi:hypothetical protein